MQSENYHLRIKPKRNLFDLDLKELWKYRDLVILFVRRDFVAVYKQTILGPLWFLIQPLLTAIMYTILFANVAKISTAGLPPILFYLSGIIPWTYFATSLTKTSETFIQNAYIFGKVYFPRLTVPVSIVISNLIQFSIQFVMLVVIILLYALSGFQCNVGLNILLVPLLLLLLAGLSLGFGILISSLTTKYRDLKQLVSFGVQLWMFGTNVLYPLSNVSGKYKVFFLINPITSIISSFRTILFGTGEINYYYLGYSAIFMIILLLIGILMFNRTERNFMDHV